MLKVIAKRAHYSHEGGYLVFRGNVGGITKASREITLIPAKRREKVGGITLVKK